MGSKPSSREKDAKIQALMEEVQTLRSQQQESPPPTNKSADAIGGLLDSFDEEQVKMRKMSCALNTGKTTKGGAKLRRNSKTGRLTVSRKTVKGGRNTVAGANRLTSIKEGGANPKQRMEVSAECRKHKMADRESMAKDAAVDFPKSQKIAALIEEAVNHNILFQAMSHGARTQCIAAFQGPRQVDKGDTVIRQNERKGEEFFVVESGCCEIVVETDGKEERIGDIHRGQSFGELSLMYHQPRAATVRATEVTRLWVLERKHYQVRIYIFRFCLSVVVCGWWISDLL